MQPLATVLKENNNDFVAPFPGYWKANASWDGQLAGTHNGVPITLAEVDLDSGAPMWSFLVTPGGTMAIPEEREEGHGEALQRGLRHSTRAADRT